MTKTTQAPSAYRQAQHSGGAAWAQYQKSNGDGKAELNDVGEVKAKYRPAGGGVSDAELGAAVTKDEAKAEGGATWDLYQDSHDAGQRLRGGKDRAGRAGRSAGSGDDETVGDGNGQGNGDGGGSSDGLGGRHDREPSDKAVDKVQAKIESAYQQGRGGDLAGVDPKLLRSRAGQEAARNVRGDIFEAIQTSGAGHDTQGTLQQRLVLQQMLSARLHYVRSHDGGKQLVDKLEASLENQTNRVKRLSIEAATEG